MSKPFRYVFLAFALCMILAPAIVSAYGDIVDVQFPCPGDPSGGLGKLCNENKGAAKTDLRAFIVQIYYFMMGFSGIVALGFLVYGGFKIATSQGSIDDLTSGKGDVMASLYGIALLFGSYFILKTINPDLVKLPDLTKNANQSLISATCQDGFKPIEVNTTSSDGTVITQEICAEEKSSNECEPFKDIKLFDGTGNLATTNIDPVTCEYRRNNSKEGVSIDNDEKYYDESEGIPAKSRVWMYPYFKDKPADAKCLIYAYQDIRYPTKSDNKNDGNVQMIDLNSNLKLCAPQKQEIKATLVTKEPFCAEWALWATEELEFGPHEWIIGTTTVSTSFNHPNPNDSILTTELGTIPRDRIVDRDLVGWKCNKTTKVNPIAQVTPTPPGQQPQQPSGGSGGKEQSSPEGKADDLAKRAQLNAVGITINKANCTSPGQRDCTSLAFLPSFVIDNLITLKRGCGRLCTIVITGGTESGHTTHGPDKPAVDLRLDDTNGSKYTAKEIARIFPSATRCTAPEDSGYRSNDCLYFNEDQRHLHVKFK